MKPYTSTIGGQMMSVATETWTFCIADEHMVCCYGNNNGQPLQLCVYLSIVTDFSYSHMKPIPVSLSPLVVRSFHCQMAKET